MMNVLETEIAIADLHTSGKFKVLRKVSLDDTRIYGAKVPAACRACAIDVETTGLDASTDRIIELGIVVFEYEPISGTITRIVGRYAGFEDPKAPLTDVIKRVTGITDEMVAGQSFNDEEILTLVQDTTLMVAHNAAFDRPFCENRFPFFANMAWACTFAEINWAAENIGSRKLDYILFQCGYFIDAHRALNDAEGVVGLLLEKLPLSKMPVFPTLLEQSGATTCLVTAIGAPFEAKDRLKARGYRWQDGSKGKAKAWWTEIREELLHAELAYLADEVYSHGNTSSVEITRIDALTRFSSRIR